MPDFQEGQTATNPKTGQKVVYRNGDWHIAPQTGPAPAPTLTGNSRNLALQKVKSLMALRRQTEQAAKFFNKNFNKQGPIQSLAEWMPSQFSDTNAQYDALIDGVAPLARAAFRVPGSGADSDKESATFMNVVPTRWSNDAGAAQKYKQMLEIIDGQVADQNDALGVKAPRTSGFRVVRR